MDKTITFNNLNLTIPDELTDEIYERALVAIKTVYGHADVYLPANNFAELFNAILDAVKEKNENFDYE